MVGSGWGGAAGSNGWTRRTVHTRGDLSSDCAIRPLQAGRLHNLRAAAKSIVRYGRQGAANSTIVALSVTDVHVAARRGRGARSDLSHPDVPGDDLEPPVPETGAAVLRLEDEAGDQAGAVAREEDANVRGGAEELDG